MAIYAPQYSNHKMIEKLRTLNTWFFYIIFSLSLFLIIKGYGLINNEILIDAASAILIICLVAYFFIDTVVEYILFPTTEDIRRADFLDNSFGTNSTHKQSVQYFDNDELDHSLYKLSVNAFQNVYWTYSVAKTLTLKKIIINSLFAITIVVFAYYGFQNSPIAIPLLQVVFSTTIFGDLIKQIIFVNRLKKTLDNWEFLFSMEEYKKNIKNYQSLVLKNLLYYETSLARTQITLPSVVFNAFNQKLTEDWKNLKIKLNIQ